MRSKPATSSLVRSATRWASALLAVLVAGGASAGDRGADGKFERRESSHFILFQDVDIDRQGGWNGTRRFEQGVLDELERAYDNLDRFMGLRPERKIQVLVYDPQIFDQSFAPYFRFPLAGVYQGVIRVRGDTQVTVQLAQVLTHELVHAAFDQAMPSFGLPAWLNEGSAEWLEARVFSKRRLSRGELNALTHAARNGGLVPISQLSTRSFGRLGPRAAQLAYLQSYAMIEYLARHYGDGAMREFYRRLVQSRNIERSMQKTFRMGVADLEAAFFAELS